MTQLMDPPAQARGPNQQLSRVDQIENRINRDVVTSISVSANRGMAVDSMSQAMEVAKLMSVSGHAVPNHLRGNPGACLAVAVQGWEWGINPFAIANKSYVVNDRLAYESALYHAVLSRRAPIKGRMKMEYEGDAQNRTCRVWAELADGGGIVEYTSPKFVTIQPKNSPLWKSDPDQQLFYFSVRSFARRHFPDVMMGISTVDEMHDVTMRVVEPTKSRTANLLEKITSRPVDERQTFEPTQDAIEQAATGDDSTVPPSEDSQGAAPVAADPQHPQPDANHASASTAGPATAPATSETIVDYADEVLGDLAKFNEIANAEAQDNLVSPNDLSVGMTKCLLTAGKVGNAKNTDLTWRRLVIDGIRGKGKFAAKFHGEKK